MRTSEERVAEMHRRMDGLKRAKALRRYRLTCAGAGAAALIVTVLLALGVSRLPIQVNDPVSGAVTASAFAGNAALGYIVVALMALCLGVFVTVFCFRLKRRTKDGDTDDGRKY